MYVCVRVVICLCKYPGNESAPAHFTVFCLTYDIAPCVHLGVSLQTFSGFAACGQLTAGAALHPAPEVIACVLLCLVSAIRGQAGLKLCPCFNLCDTNPVLHCTMATEVDHTDTTTTFSLNDIWPAGAGGLGVC
jgi:hypothetical protein